MGPPDHPPPHPVRDLQARGSEAGNFLFGNLLNPFPRLRGWSVRSSKDLLSRSERLPNYTYCFVEVSDHIEPSRLCTGPQLYLSMFHHLLLCRQPITTELSSVACICVLAGTVCWRLWIGLYWGRGSQSHPQSLFLIYLEERQCQDIWG